MTGELQAHGVSVTLGDAQILHEVDLVVAPGETVALRMGSVARTPAHACTRAATGGPRRAFAMLRKPPGSCFAS